MKASGTSTSGLAESQELSWMESTQRSWNSPASSESSTETSLPPTCARPSTTLAKKRSSSALTGQRSRHSNPQPEHRLSPVSASPDACRGESVSLRA